MKGYEYFILIICVTLFFYLTFHTNGLFIPISLLFTYSMMYLMFRKLKKSNEESFEQKLFDNLLKGNLNLDNI